MGFTFYYQFQNWTVILIFSLSRLSFFQEGENLGKGTGSGHRTLLYGNAILLRHQNSDMVSKIIFTRVRESGIKERGNALPRQVKKV
ncbi:hypothetical protein M8J77_014325 [Diaphorina citri]|nr:hypothetical protein M8J77_014325 [Diaphorina citri]